jgi:predicted glycosyltransferase/predicted transcriptional regulator
LSAYSGTGAKPTAPKPQKKVKKIWVAMSTPFQANFFAPLIKTLEKEYEFLVTSRAHDNIFSILKAKKIDFVPVGRHGGKELPDKLQAYAQTIEEMIPIVRREKPDLLLTERWPEAVRVAFGFDIPAWTIFYDEREKHVNQMVFPISAKVFAPKFYTLQDLYRNGVTDPEKIVWFNGFHTCYLKGEEQNSENAYAKLGAKPPIVLVRPEPEFASFFPSHKPVLETAVANIAKSGMASVVVMPRTEAQTVRYRRMDVNIVDESTSMCPVSNADVALGAAETMLMEALVLGKPAVSAIYWTLSKPVVELHRYIPHSTDPKQLTDYVERLLGSDERKSFKEKASLLVRNMDNPIAIMIDEIRKIGMEMEEVTLKRRSRMEILLDIIQASSLQPLRPTHIMRAANISYNELKPIVDSLETKGLITSEETFGGRYYHATSDGLRLLEEYRAFKDKLFGG